MSIPINQPRQLIEKYFNLLVKEFITDPRHNKDISIVFANQLESSKKNTITLGNTEQTRIIKGSRVEWQTINGVKVSGSEKTIHFPDEYAYTITFLNCYKDMDELRGTVVHEFTHLYLYSTAGSHGHDSRFYSTMEWLESWLDKNQGLSPRVDKSHDRDQLEDAHSKVTNDKENICPECSYPSPHHSPQCSQNQTSPHPTNQPKPGKKTDITNDSQMAAEFDSLKNSLENSRNLTTLESTYQTIKNNPLYQGENNNKKLLDNLYQQKKQFLQFLNNNQRFSTGSPDSSNKGRFGSKEYFLIALTAVGIVLVVVIAYLLTSENQTSTKPKKKII